MDFYRDTFIEDYYAATPTEREISGNLGKLYSKSKRYEPQQVMRKEIFENSHFYLGFSYNKRKELGKYLHIHEYVTEGRSKST